MLGRRIQFPQDVSRHTPVRGSAPHVGLWGEEGDENTMEECNTILIVFSLNVTQHGLMSADMNNTEFEKP